MYVYGPIVAEFCGSYMNASAYRLEAMKKYFISLVPLRWYCFEISKMETNIMENMFSTFDLTSRGFECIRKNAIVI